MSERVFWPTQDHWSVRIPLDTPHLRLEQLAETGLRRAPRRRLRGARRRSTRRSSTWTGRAAATPTSPRSRRPTASSTAAASGTRARRTRTPCGPSNADARARRARVRRRRRRQLRSGARHQARTAVARGGDPVDPSRRQQPLQPRRRGLGRAVVAGADGQPRQLHAADGQRSRRAARPVDRGPAAAAPRRPLRRRHPAPVARRRAPRRRAPRYALITSFESGPVLGAWIDAERATVGV